MKITVKKVEPVGKKIAFVSRICCGPYGEGECLAAKEELPCGIGYVNVYPKPTKDGRTHGEKIRKTRLEMNLSLRDAANLLEIDIVTMSALELGSAEVDDWDEVETALRMRGKN